ncbi:hypothetical protein ACJZ2D_012366 [Fusarium nematophilum]
MALAEPPPLSSGVYPTSIHSSRHSSWAATGLPDFSRVPNSSDGLTRFYDIGLPSGLDGLHIESINALAALDSISTRCATPDKVVAAQTRPAYPRMSVTYVDKSKPKPHRDRNTPGKRPFRRWIRSLQRRASRRSEVWRPEAEWGYLETSDTHQEAFDRRASHRKSSSGSSLGFIAAIQSASISLASASAAARSRRYNGRSHCASRTDRSSRASLSAPRFSEDSTPLERVKVDVAAIQRSLQRRQILEELISTEESYIGDIRFLMHAYITMLAALPSLPERLRSSINSNLTQIVQLHEEILGELHRVIPDSEYEQLDHPMLSSKMSNPGNGHDRRWRIGALSESQVNWQWLQNVPGMVLDPQVAAEMPRFFIYKEYGAKYEMMIKDVAAAHETLPEWETYQRGIEALGSSLGSTTVRGGECKKSLTIGDLLVKPIQRICKYPLLFAELLRCTPVVDCPNSHMEVETALVRLREATAEINRSTANNHMKDALKKTWLLQDRMVFPERRLDASSKNQVRSFGHIQLCGVLHVSWQTEDSVEGQYMICLLYRDVLCLASGGKFDPIYTVLACIDLHGTKIENADNGRGLQCYLAPYSWKLVFESDHQLYELVMTACTSKEETEWRNRLHRSPDPEQDVQVSGLNNFLSLDIKSLGPVFGRPGTIARRMSVHRATTVGPKSPLFHVILKNTSAMRSGIGSTVLPAGLHRSQSMLSTKPRIPVLAPPRSERARLEVLLADIWSQDILPLPGMTSIARNEQIVRRSASTMMRKLSVASMVKRSASVSHRPNEDSTATGITQQTSGSSESDFGIVKPIDFSGSSNLNIIKAALPETQEMSEDEDWMSGTRSPTSEITQVSEIQALGLVQMIGGTKLGDDLNETLVLQTSATNSLRASSSQGSRKSGTFPESKENTHPSASMPILRSSSRWGKVRNLKIEGKGHGLRRFFR